jgi:hypothetical protein
MKGYNTGIAAEYFILSQLYRQNIEAHITIGNKKTIDIRIINSEGKALSLDVKAVRGYSSLIINNVEKKENHYIAFVIYNDKFEKIDTLPDVYIVHSLEIEKYTKFFKKEARVYKTSLLDQKDRWDLIK